MDSRFSRLASDPRFRRPKHKKSQLETDERFKQVLEGGDDFDSKSVKTDAFGRPISHSHRKDQLKQFYKVRPESSEDAATEDKFVDYARGEGVLESSGSEDEEDEEEDDNSSDEEAIVTTGVQPKRGILDSETEPSDQEFEGVDLDESSSVGLPDNLEEQPQDEEPIDPTARLALVNMDWDNMRAIDIFTAFSSILTSAQKQVDRKASSSASSAPDGKLINVRIYPSEFGKERIAQEEKMGPLVEARHENQSIEQLNNVTDLSSGHGSRRQTHNANSHEDSQDGEELNDDGTNMDKLRTYQLERLRYYYAIATFSSAAAATYVFREVNGTEFERTANIFDITFVPDDMDFDSEWRDEAEEEDKSYKGTDYVTDALRHSNVKLTWDQDDPNRTRVLRRAFEKGDIEEGDFKAYLANSSDEDESSDAEGSTRRPKASGSGGHESLRDLLLAGTGEDDVWGKASGHAQSEGSMDASNKKDMNITFKAGLSSAVDQNDDEQELTTIQKYERRMQEKTKRKKEKKELRKGTKELDASAADATSAQDDDFFGIAEPTQPTKRSGGNKASVEDEDEDAKHFSMADIVRAEKQESKKGRKRGRKNQKDQEPKSLQDDFNVNLKDDRFNVLYDEPAYAIDPSNPHYIKTKNMGEIVNEGKRRRGKTKSSNLAPTELTNKANDHASEQPLKDLIATVKTDSQQADSHTPARKRRRHR